MASRRKEGKYPKADPKKGKKISDPLLTFAEKARVHNDMDSRWAVLQEARVEYFRGQDFAAFIQKNKNLSDAIFSPETANEENIAEAIVDLMLKRKLVVRCDRVNKSIRPGKKKLSKWPARLEIYPSQKFTEEESFYAWTFERRRPIWQTALSIFLAIFTVACCLFPVFPIWTKLSVLYFCLGLLSLISGVLLLRYLVFGFLWILLGKRIWFFPNILEEEGSLEELFRFLPEKDEEPPPKWTTRIAVTGFTIFIIWLSVTHAPDQRTRAKYRKKVTNIIDDVVAWTPAMLGGNQTVANVTSPIIVQVHNETNEEGVPMNDTEKVEQIFAKAADLAADLDEDVLDEEVDAKEVPEQLRSDSEDNAEL